MLIPTETVLKMHEFFGIGCCEEVADFEMSLSALISLPLTCLVFGCVLKVWKIIQGKIKERTLATKC